MLEPLQSGTSKHVILTDWSKFVFSKEDLSEVLHCPAESRCNTLGAGYKMISDFLVGFSRIGCFLKTIDLSHLDDGDGMRQHFSSIKPSGMIHPS